jgi:Ran GTPase-activating protein (RanGAP) involved in mRNA processing and transport
MQKIQAILQRMAEGETDLDLANRGLSDADVKDIAMTLIDNHTLTVLDLSGNEISAAGANDITIALKDNHTLTELYLSENQISDAGAQDIARALKDNHSLTVLDLNGNKISAAGAKDIAMALKDNHTLTELYLSENQISEAGAKDIAMALKNNHTLTRLVLGINKIRAAGAKDLARALKDNNTLTELYLQDNQISDAGAQDIARALKDNHTLMVLDLSDNNISAAGAEDIKSFLSRNTTYQEKYSEALKYRDIASALLKSPEIDVACLSSLNEALDMADKITEDLQNTGYNQAAVLSCQVNALRASAHLQTGNIRAGLDLYVNKLQPQPAEAVSLAIADLILDEQTLPDENANRALILMCLRGTTQYSAMQFNALQKLRGIDKFTSSQPLTTLLGVDKIVSVLDVSKPEEKMQETETCIFYEDLVLSPLNPPVHKVFKGDIPPCVELSHQFEVQKKALLDSLKLAYPENPREDEPTSSTPFRY